MKVPMRRRSALRRLGLGAAAVAAAAVLAGCTTVMAPPMASGATVQSLKGLNLVPANVGTFKLAAGKPKEMDFELSGGLRGGNIEAPERSFSQYLRSVLMAELNSAGLLDLQSKAVIEGQLTESKVDAAIGTGTGRLGARFQVLRDGLIVFDKEVIVDDSWDSSFLGAVAIPLAIERYTGLYRLLVAKLVADADFRRALAVRPPNALVT